MKTFAQISCIILAAGTARRMGKPKQLLPLGNTSILERVIHQTLKESFSEIITVIGHKASVIKQEIIIHDPRFRWVKNEHYLTGQSSSLKVGINHIASDNSSFMVFLGDLPFISNETIQEVLETGVHMEKKTNDPFMIRPTYQGVAGHPVFFGNMDENFFNKLDGDQGAKVMIKEIDCQVYLDVTDEGIIKDIDTPDDYEFARQMIEDTWNR